MEKCNGRCLTYCVCTCYQFELLMYYEECVCGHREHEGQFMCKPQDACCDLIRCPMCEVPLPMYLLEANYGTCCNCAKARAAEGGWAMLMLDGYLQHVMNDREKFEEFVKKNIERLKKSNISGIEEISS